jgi:hypothetical protein
MDLLPDELFEDVGFRWPVSAHGYDWYDRTVLELGRARDESPTLPVLTDGQRHRSDKSAPYPPPEPPPGAANRLPQDLFFTFAETPKTNEGIREFANRWGLLGVKVKVVWPKSEGATDFFGGWAEQWHTWAMEIGEMGRAIAIWRALEPGMEDRLRALFRWEDHGGPARSGRWVYTWHSPDGSSAHWHPVEQAAGRAISANDIRTPGRILLHWWVTRHLRDHTSPVLLLKPEPNKSVIRIRPKNLLGAMWLQFARAIAGEVRHRACKVCGKYITISTEQGGARADRVFCTAACRQRDHRRKVREAHAMKAAGKTVRQIAKHFDTEKATIEKWLTKEK